MNKLLRVVGLLYTEPEHVQNFTVVIVSQTWVQLFWCTDDQAKLYTVFWKHHTNKVCACATLSIFTVFGIYTVSKKTGPLLHFEITPTNCA